eukprot:CAMPEP_0197586068 /NCGR_PEP_ID=MMETSP1326-20131121/8172_1 /TAXON_ID=1155430 /ORGANISM="Genus nov. species nov., Strain RCC2288" /LENGTH=222 /DNA_ID=CAMNT_0043150659 /DNA_START=252 /DNA_END=920 /DNA_ORIENTATION=-
MRSVMPGDMVFSPLSSGRIRYTRELLTAVREARVTHGMVKGPLYFMFMSNGGCWLHATMSSTGMLAPGGEFADLDVAVSGTIFDSCPAFMSPQAGAKVISLGMGPVYGFITRTIFYTARLLLTAATVLGTGSQDALVWRVFWRSVREAPPRRELYLYSDSDPLCEAAKVAELVAERRGMAGRVKGVARAEVTEVRWATSRHCTHLLDQRDEYMLAWKVFMKL